MGWSRLLRYGAVLALINHRAQMVPGKAESDLSLHHRNTHFGTETDLFNFQCSCTNFGVLQTKEFKYFDPKAKTT